MLVASVRPPFETHPISRYNGIGSLPTIFTPIPRTRGTQDQHLHAQARDLLVVGQTARQLRQRLCEFDSEASPQLRLQTGEVHRRIKPGDAEVLPARGRGETTRVLSCLWGVVVNSSVSLI